MHQQDSRLLMLAPEIRNRIYSYSLVKPEPEKVFYTSPASMTMKGHFERSDKWPSPFSWQPPALLQTYQQTRAEASAMYYAVNCFSVVYERGPRFVTLKKWLGSLSQENLRNLTQVGVKIPISKRNWMIGCTGLLKCVHCKRKRIFLVRELHQLWLNFMTTDLQLEFDVLGFLLPNTKPNPKEKDTNVADHEEYEWLSMARLERGRKARKLSGERLNWAWTVFYDDSGSLKAQT